MYIRGKKILASSDFAGEFLNSDTVSYPHPLAATLLNVALRQDPAQCRRTADSAELSATVIINPLAGSEKAAKIGVAGCCYHMRADGLGVAALLKCLRPVCLVEGDCVEARPVIHNLLHLAANLGLGQKFGKQDAFVADTAQLVFQEFVSFLFMFEILFVFFVRRLA